MLCIEPVYPKPVDYGPKNNPEQRLRKEADEKEDSDNGTGIFNGMHYNVDNDNEKCDAYQISPKQHHYLYEKRCRPLWRIKV